MSTANAKKGSAIELRPGRETTPQAPTRRPTPEPRQDQGLLLAQIPDLDPIATPKVAENRPDGRIISQGLSFKVIFGVGLGLVVGAILPFVFGKGSRHDAPVTELPAWSNPGGSSGTGNTAQSTAPAWPSSPTTQASAAFPPQNPPTQSPAVLFPQPPQAGDARPTALAEPAWPQQRSAVPPPAALAPPPNNAFGPPSVAAAVPHDNRGDYRSLDRPADPGTLQADNRNNPALQYRNNDSRYDYRANTADTNPVRRDVPNGGYTSDNRYNNVNSYPPATGQNSPLMPSGVPGAPAPTSVNRDPQYTDPGVARFDGTISSPSRTGYDRAGLGN
jgi:hypothetical protein